MNSAFQAFSPSYENISNRMSRLKHHSQNQRTCYPSSSPPKTKNFFIIDAPSKPLPAPRIIPNGTSLKEDPFSNGKFTGRINKNVGLKKYNQRQLREVMTSNKEFNYTKTEGNGFYPQPSKIRLCTEGNSGRQFTDVSNTEAKKQGLDEIKMNEEERWGCEKMNILQTKLIPGKMYKREYLATLIKN